MKRNRLAALAMAALLGPSVQAYGLEAEATITNTNGKDLANLPVFVKVSSVFGNGIDFTQLNPSGSHIHDPAGREVEFMYRPMPPAFSVANDELIFVIPRLGKDAELTYRFANKPGRSAKQRPLDVNGLLANPNNWVPNGGFEGGNEGWAGGKVVADEKHSGGKCLLVEADTPGKAEARLERDFTFIKGGHYYFSCWAKCENVSRSGYRWANGGGRIILANDPLMGSIPKVQDTRDWYCYKNDDYGRDGDAAPWSFAAVTSNVKGELTGRRRKTKSKIWLSGGKSGLSISLSQMAVSYVDKSRPGRIWVDEIMLFDRPRIVFSYDKALTKARLGKEFVYSRPVTKGNVNSSPRPLPWEKVGRIREVAARGERKVIPLGVVLPGGGKGVTVEGSQLTGPGRLKPGEVEYQVLPWAGFKWGGWEWWAHDLTKPIDYDRPCHIDFFIAYRIPRDAKAGVYKGEFVVKADGKAVQTVPVELDVADYPLKVITDRFIGAIYNSGMGTDGGAKMPPNTMDFWRFCSRSNFTYVMMFASFLPWRGNQCDVPSLLKKMKAMRDEGGCTAGVGLYWDVALDRFGRRSLARALKNDREAYRAEVKRIDKALADAGLPRLMYMIWDEPRSVSNAFGVLQGTGALTTCDAMGDPFFQCLKYITHTSYDDPGYEMGPAVYRHCHKLGKRFGFCGTAWVDPGKGRYQVGMMMAAAKAHYWHQWHILNFYGVSLHTGKFVRNRAALGFGEGMIDLRYHDTLTDAISYAEKRGKGIPEARAARKYLDQVLGFCNGDMDTWLTFYNGTPTDWGDDRFFGSWRREMRRHTLAILAKTGPVPEGK